MCDTKEARTIAAFVEHVDSLTKEEQTDLEERTKSALVNALVAVESKRELNDALTVWRDKITKAGLPTEIEAFLLLQASRDHLNDLLKPEATFFLLAMCPRKTNPTHNTLSSESNGATEGELSHFLASRSCAVACDVRLVCTATLPTELSDKKRKYALNFGNTGAQIAAAPFRVALQVRAALKREPLALVAVGVLARDVGTLIANKKEMHSVTHPGYMWHFQEGNERTQARKTFETERQSALKALGIDGTKKVVRDNGNQRGGDGGGRSASAPKRTASQTLREPKKKKKKNEGKVSKNAKGGGGGGRNGRSAPAKRAASQTLREPKKKKKNDGKVSKNVVGGGGGHANNFKITEKMPRRQTKAVRDNRKKEMNEFETEVFDKLNILKSKVKGDVKLVESTKKKGEKSTQFEITVQFDSKIDRALLETQAAWYLEPEHENCMPRKLHCVPAQSAPSAGTLIKLMPPSEHEHATFSSLYGIAWKLMCRARGSGTKSVELGSVKRALKTVQSPPAPQLALNSLKSKYEMKVAPFLCEMKPATEEEGKKQQLLAHLKIYLELSNGEPRRKLFAALNEAWAEIVNATDLQKVQKS